MPEIVTNTYLVEIKMEGTHEDIKSLRRHLNQCVDRLVEDSENILNYHHIINIKVVGKKP